MIRKILAGALVLAVLAAALTVLAANVIQRKAPDFLREALERSLNKKVVIQNIAYRFPRSFDLEGFQVQEKGAPFDGDIAFYVDRVSLDLSPLVFSRKALIITSLEIHDAQIVVRKYRGKLYHVLSDVLAAPAIDAASSEGSVQKPPAVRLPLDIHQILLKKSQFKFADYDTGEKGFVLTLDNIDARIRSVRLPADEDRTSYELTADLLQDRDQRPARVRASGWTDFRTLDTDAKVTLEKAHLPYFRPYYSQVTGSVFEDGYADARARLWMKNGLMELNAGFELSGLLFAAYEDGEQLFGMKAEQVLSFLKDSAGRLRFQISVQWNTADRSVKLREIVRSSIARSLRDTLLGSVGNVLMNALQKAAENVESPGKKGGVEERIKKIKDFFKY